MTTDLNSIFCPKPTEENCGSKNGDGDHNEDVNVTPRQLYDALCHNDSTHSYSAYCSSALPHTLRL